jgi:carbon storage regulator
MLVLTRKVGEKIYLGENIVVTVTAISGQQVRLGFTAPPEVAILRNELVVRGEAPQVEAEAQAAERENKRQRPLRTFRPGRVHEPV